MSVKLDAFCMKIHIAIINARLLHVTKHEKKVDDAMVGFSIKAANWIMTFYPRKQTNPNQ
jgi:hypothetical protein